MSRQVYESAASCIMQKIKKNIKPTTTAVIEKKEMQKVY